MRCTLVLHPGALGDVLLAVPALRALRRQAPDDELVLAAQPRIGRLLTSLGIVDRHLTFETLGIESLFVEDDPPPRVHELVAGARVVSWFGARDPVFVRQVKTLAPGAILAAPAPPAGATVWAHLLSSVADEDGQRDPIEIPAALAREGSARLREAGWDGARPLVMLHPGAGGAAKRWAPEGFAALAGALVDAADVQIVVHEGPADRDAVAALLARLRAPILTVVEPPLDVLAGAFHHLALWIGNDSGVSHLAAAVGAPALVLFAEANLPWRSWARAARPRLVTLGTLAPLEVEEIIAEATTLLGPHGRRAIRRESVR